ncbi:uncharacterized protein LOC112513273 [Cynara cardunculus var. scolymus]|uniref:uncharacterized protein LOC112513273 n=1 Tax=Cynara cardunculus var. scolymus TaxID=59895 RepID=UPI000D626F30|nr:uncharacterized protein LOC112513273 [Cynara cardunculus var. scolymus]
MYQETSSKYSNLKKRAKFALGKSVNSSRDKVKTLDFKKKGFGGNDRRGQSTRVKTDNIVSNVEDEFFKRSGRSDNMKSKNDRFRGDRSKRVVTDNGSSVDGNLHKKDFRGRGLKSNYRGRNVGEVQGNESNGFAGRDFDRKRKRIYANNDSNGESKFHNKAKVPVGKGLSRARWNAGKEDLVKGNETARRGSRASASLSQNRHSNGRETPDGGDRRKNTEHRENRSVLLRNNGEGKHETSKQLRLKQTGPAEDSEFGKKKFQNKKNLVDDSVAMFDRPRRKRRIMRIEYPNDTANKRFDDSIPAIDNTTEQKEDSDNEENTELSKNAQFRAIQPSPSIISFVEENILGRRREIEFRKAGYNIELSSPLDNIPFSTSSERERIEESVFRNKLAFFAAAKVSSSFPSPDLPEIAFAGRSNVGKSSLLNSLTRQWGVVRTSDKPGLTQTINFFNLGSKLCLVDLPGYGFAYAKEEVKESWEELVKEYVSTREGLKRVCLLIDTKWGMKPRDHELVDLMEKSKTKYQIVLTKTDLVFPIDVARRAMQIEESLKTKKSAVQPLMMVSSKTGAGIRSLRTVLSNISRFARL